jgi:outer membrane protein
MHKNYLNSLRTLFVVLVVTQIASAQTKIITLEECYQLSRTNYPAIKKLDLVAKTSDYDVENASKRFLPQVNFSGQATYQSQTINFGDAAGSLPIAFPSISKDQYKVQGEVSQLLYDGGVTKNQKELIQANAAYQGQNIESNLYAIKQRVNSIYFSVLLMDAQLKQNELNVANLQTQIQKTQAALANGVAFQSSLDELKAEILNIEMARTEYQSNKLAYLKMLSLFMGQDLPGSTQLQTPATESIPAEIGRPELKVFEFQKLIYNVQEKQLKSDYMPQVSAFFQGAYGRPTLNIIENKFGPWFVTGVRFSWSLGSLYTLSNKRNTLNLNRQSVDADSQTFLLNTRLDLAQQDEQINKYTALIRQDAETVALRASVVKSAEAQLENGVITTHEYIQKLNAENLAKQTRIIHEIQLLQSRYSQKFISGN